MLERRPVVLIVDDDRGVRGALASTFEEEYEAVEAVSGPEALQVFEERRFDAVVLDIRMPEMGGLEVLRRMKAIEPRVEVILLSALDDVPTVVEGDFEWDSAKAESNLKKHGVSFFEAATVFADPFAVYLDDGSGVGTLVVIGASLRERVL